MTVKVSVSAVESLIPWPGVVVQLTTSTADGGRAVEIVNRLAVDQFPQLPKAHNCHTKCEPSQ